MAQLFLDNPSIYHGGNLSAWWVGGAVGTTSNANLPPGAQAGSYTLYGNGDSTRVSFITNNFGAKARMIAGCHANYAGGGGNIIQFGYSPSPGFIQPVAAVALYTTGTIITDGLLNNGNPNILATGPIIPVNEWHHYEFDVTFGTASNATLSLYLDGNPTPFMQVTGATLQNATATMAAFYTFSENPSNSELNKAINGYINDGYVFDGTGGAPWNAALAPQGLGEPVNGFAFMNGPGITSAWTPNGAATDWQCTTTVPPGDTPFASSSTIGQTFFGTLGTIPAVSHIIGTQVSTYAKQSTTGARAIQSGLSDGATTVFSGTDDFLSTSSAYFFDEHETNPVTAAPWAVADLTTLQIGEKLTV